MFLRQLGPCLLLLVAVGCGQSTAHWLAQMKSPDPATRVQAVHALQKRVNEKAVVLPVLIEALKDDHKHVRRDAAKALGAFGAEARDAVGPLVARLGDPEPSVRKAAMQALTDIDPTSLPK